MVERTVREFGKVIYIAGTHCWRMDTCVCMADSLCCSPENITTLLIGYSPIQNKKLGKKYTFCRCINNKRDDH